VLFTKMSPATLIYYVEAKGNVHVLN
jgi:hypothetical protein